MANGQQEQQSVVTGQQQGVTQQQPAVVQQQPNIYQSFMNMNPAQLRNFQANYHLVKQKDEVLRNVGDSRLEEYESEIEAGKMTWSQAVDLSKKDMSNYSRSLDNLYYKKDDKGKSLVTSTQLEQWYEANKNKVGFGEAEQRRFDSRYNAVVGRENARNVALGKISAAEAENVQAIRNYENDMQYLQNSIKNATRLLYQTNKFGEFLTFTDPQTKTTSKIIAEEDEIETTTDAAGKKTKKVIGKKKKISVEDEKYLSNAIAAIEQEMYYDMGYTIEDGKLVSSPETRGSGNQEVVYRNINVIANLVPKDFLIKRRGFYIGENDKFVPNRAQQIQSEDDLRWMFRNELERRYLKAQNHLTGLKNPNPMGIGQNRQESTKQPQLPTINTNEDYENLPSGTVFIDPNGNRRTKP